MFLYPPSFLDVPMFCIYFAAPIFLYIFLHSYLVCAKNSVGANILRFFRLTLIIVRPHSYCFIPALVCEEGRKASTATGS